MPRRHPLRGPTNPYLLNLVSFLRKKARENEAKIWRDIADRLKRRKVVVNMSKLNRFTSKGDTVVVPGKVLGAGGLDHPINVAAFQFSKSAKKKITSARGKCFMIEELVEKNPKGSFVKVIC
jgi:large subunit ribosomal protein L18e